jgi:hypothetical protein
VDHGLELGSCYGQFKDEMNGQEIIAFSSVGAKNYSIRYISNEDGQIKDMTKLKGFSLNAQAARKFVNAEVMQEFAERLLDGDEDAKKPVPHFNIRRKLRSMDMQNLYQTKVFSNDICTKRVPVFGCLRNSFIQTIPYGYCPL